MGDATQMVREILETASCMINRRLAGGAIRTVSAEGENYDLTIPAGRASQTAYTLEVGEPIVSNDLTGERRFSVPATVVEHGLSRGLNVPVPERSGASHVILAQGYVNDRAFSVEDARFLEAVAHVVAGALDRAGTEHELRRRALEDPLT
jgi:GAF domain-containing protein